MKGIKECIKILSLSSRFTDNFRLRGLRSAIDGEVLRRFENQIFAELRGRNSLRISWFDKHCINYNSPLCSLRSRRPKNFERSVFAVVSIITRLRNVERFLLSAFREREKEKERQPRNRKGVEEGARTKGRELTSHYRPSDICIPLVAYALLLLEVKALFIPTA